MTGRFLWEPPRTQHAPCSEEARFGRPCHWINLSTINVINSIAILAIDGRKNSSMLVDIEPAPLMTTDIGDRAECSPEHRPVPNSL